MKVCGWTDSPKESEWNVYAIPAKTIIVGVLITLGHCASGRLHV